MKLNIQELLHDCGIEETLYPGKRLVHRLPQTGEYKSHCIVYDWRTENLLRMEVKPGLTGMDMTKKEIARYPLSFQSPTYVEIETRQGGADTDEEESREGEEESGAAGGRSGEGKGFKAGARASLHAFSKVVEGNIPSLGEVKKLVVMGKEIATEAFESVLRALASQIKNMVVAPVNLLASVTNVTRIAPGGRKPEDADARLFAGAKPYRPQDMFGAAPAPK